MFQDKIDRFIGQYSFLSNFYPSSIFIKGKRYATAEHAYQAYKAYDEATHELIRNAKTPLEAKKLGRSLPLPENWDSIRVDLMRSIIKSKFENPFLRELLKNTENLELIHNNKFNDKFWGISCGQGENWLGRILEEVRKEINSDYF